MKSKWYELKSEAISLRLKGNSLRNIERETGIPKSTLSGWLKDVKLTPSQLKKLDGEKRKKLVKAREKASLWHSKQKEKRIDEAKESARLFIDGIQDTKASHEIALAILYLGEGFKKNSFGIGNSDSKILRFFVKSVKVLYQIDPAEIRCDLNLRFDQSKDEMITYWSTQLGIPTSNFKTISFDIRTKGKKTYEGYYGVCQLRCGNIALLRRILYISQYYCDRITSIKGS